MLNTTTNVFRGRGIL